MGTLRDDLGAEADELRETHISWVFMTGDAVFKVKKPVDLGFLDFSTIEKREAACRAELELNRRLAPDVYRGLVPVVRSDDGVHRLDLANERATEDAPSCSSPSDEREGASGAIVDWAVHMRRLRDEDRADVLLEQKEIDLTEIDRMATVVAELHARNPSDAAIARFGHPDVIGGNVRENFEQTREAVRALLSEEEAGEIEEWQLSFLSEREPLFLERMERGRIRDGHGDLRLEHFYLEGEDRSEVRVLDCIEFNERFRYADVCADIAFLSMDLAWHGRVDLAERALATYARETSDFDLYPLVDFYEGYRAYVRGKVATMLAADPSASSWTRARARREARRYFLLALAVERRSMLPPFVVAVGGVIASGKSTVADRLGAIIGAPAINTDRIRKHLLGAKATDKLYDGSWSGAYDPRFTEEVYAEVRRAARSVVRSGRPVILDASFRSVSMREDARALAEDLGVPFRFVECRVDPDVARARLRERDMATSVSDGRSEIFDDFLAKWEPVGELPEGQHVTLDTARPIEETIAELRERLPTWPEGFTQ